MCPRCSGLEGRSAGGGQRDKGCARLQGAPPPPGVLRFPHEALMLWGLSCEGVSEDQAPEGI